MLILSGIIPFLYFCYTCLIFCSVSCATASFGSCSNSSSTDPSELSNALSIITNVTSPLDASKYSLSNEQSMDSAQLIKYYGGYTSEEHTIESNGYILKLFRIKNTGPSVLIFHGLFATSDNWLTLGSNSLPLYLASQGYDIWLGNARGNTYSRKHVNLSTSDPEFWDFSWHEIGTEDIASTTDYICKTAGVPKITYIGHSQGTTSVYALLSTKPEYNDKMLGVISLASVSYIGNADSPLLQLVVKLRPELQAIFEALKLYELFPHRPPTSLLTAVCGSSKILTIVLLTALYAGFGYDYEQIDFNMTQVQLDRYPGGSSLRQALHYLQNVNSNEFQMYDFGATKNEKLYGSSVAPNYEVEKISTNMSIIYGDNDWLSNYPKDVSRFIDRLPRPAEVKRVVFDKWNHMDYQWGKDAKPLVYELVNGYVAKYNS